MISEKSKKLKAIGNLKNKPKASVIILNWNRYKDTRVLVKMLERQTFKNFEVIIVDNHSTDNSIKLLKKEFPAVKYVTTRKNEGVPAKNYGFRAAKGEYLISLDSDVVIGPGLVTQFVSKLDRNDDLGIACASLFDYKTTKYLGPNRAIKGDNQRGYNVCFYAGAAIALRKEVFTKTGGYNWDYFVCLEELEWATRVLEKGYDIRCFTDIKVYNKRSENGGEYRSRQGYWYSRNWLLFYARYLPTGSILSFLYLHANSLFKKSAGKNSGVSKTDSIVGVLHGLPLALKYLFTRSPVKESTLLRIKADLFRNPDSLYVE